MNNPMLKNLKRKPKWKITQERDELLASQKSLRSETDELKDLLIKLQTEERDALINNDESRITELDVKINAVVDKIAKNDERYKNNANILEVYSKIVKNDREGGSSRSNAVVGAVTGLGGMALGYFGLRKSFQSDMDGTMHNKKTLEWVKSFFMKKK